MRNWRQLCGLTQAVLTAASGVNRVQIANIESGAKTGSVATLRKLADALEVTLDDLAWGGTMRRDGVSLTCPETGNHHYTPSPLRRQGPNKALPTHRRPMAHCRLGPCLRRDDGRFGVVRRKSLTPQTGEDSESLPATGASAACDRDARRTDHPSPTPASKQACNPAYPLLFQGRES